MIYPKVLQYNIEKEKEGIDYAYTNADREILEQLLKDINDLALTDFHYLAELDAFNIPQTGQIIARYIKKFKSESVRGYLVPQMVSDRIKDCDKLVLALYLHFKESEEYISEPNSPSSAHIYVRYDNAFRKLKPKRLKKDLVQLAHNPRDAFYLPFTMRMLASWKIPEIKEILLNYLESSNITAESVGIEESEKKYYPSLESIKRDLKFTALAGLKYYPTEEVVETILQYVFDVDEDLRIMAKKTLKVLEKKMKVNDE